MKFEYLNSSSLLLYRAADFVPLTTPQLAQQLQQLGTTKNPLYPLYLNNCTKRKSLLLNTVILQQNQIFEINLVFDGVRV
ncbi:hypothetical protein T01_9504 [Trichinella spiralis]|uniref:Uncharacterized protein n=1 Tax=Trichinella spiralis TaxID=6334 RepID=A0A0V1ASV6_TRISP|nr:hypothetical protein T01_9504 [Trichinella spiralis]